MSLLSPISTIQRYVALSAGVALLVVSGVALHENHLRGKHLSSLTDAHTALADAGIKADLNLPDTGIKLLAAQRDTSKAERDTSKAERDTARNLVDIQSKSIERLHQETSEAEREATANRKIAEEAAKQRDFWIKQARTASTRTERLAAEQEVQECEAVSDSLYSSGF